MTTPRASSLPLAVLLAGALFALLAVAPGVRAERDPTDPYWDHRTPTERGELPFDESLVDPWVESGAAVPGLPPDDELTALDLAELPPGMRAYTHRPSISVDEGDRVVRYWLVIKGDGGGYNATYEGLRCNTREYKIYAYGHQRRQVQVKPVADPKWQSLDADRSAHRRETAAGYFCSGVTSRTLHQIGSLLRGGQRQAYPFSEYTE